MAYKGRFNPKNPSKYLGDPKNIIWRSRWEYVVMKKLDRSDNVLEWASEELAIPYFDPVKQRARRYFPDFFVKYKDKHDNLKKALIEVKPHDQTNPPKQRKRKTQKLIREAKTYATNVAKWKAAELFCEQQGWIFMIWTEKNCNF